MSSYIPSATSEEKKTTALSPSKEAEAAVQAGIPTGQVDGKKGLTGVPLKTKIYKGVQTVPGPEGRGRISVNVYGETQYKPGSGATVFATKSNQEKLNLLLRMSKIPNLYKEGEAYTEQQILSFAASGTIPLRTEDYAALEKVMFLADTTGDDYETTLTAVETNPALAIAAFGTQKAKKLRLTPAAALGLELEQSLMDYLDVPVSDAEKKSYAKRVNEEERKRGGALTELERKEILNDTIQDTARKALKTVGEDAAGLMRRGALGETYNTLRQTYNNFGVPATDRDVYRQAIDSIRSKQAFDNIVNKIKLQAEVTMPALKTYIQQGLTPREALGTYINYYSKALGVPSEQVDLNKLMPVVSGDKILPFQDWQKYIQKLPEFKNGPLYQQQQFSDAQALRRNFLG